MNRRGFIRNLGAAAATVAVAPKAAIADLLQAAPAPVQTVARKLNPSFDELASRTLANHRTQVIDNVFGSQPLAYWLKESDNEA